MLSIISQYNNLISDAAIETRAQHPCGLRTYISVHWGLTCSIVKDCFLHVVIAARLSSLNPPQKAAKEIYEWRIIQSNCNKISSISVFLPCILLSTQENSSSKYSRPYADWQYRRSWRYSLDSTLPIDFVERDTNLNHVSKIWLWLGYFLIKINN